MRNYKKKTYAYKKDFIAWAKIYSFPFCTIKLFSKEENGGKGKGMKCDSESTDIYYITQ